VSDWVETLYVSTKGWVIHVDENGLDVLITSSRDQSRDIKGTLFKALYLINHMSDRVETFHVSSKGSVIDEN
jgi:hypothetical protein